MMTEISSRMLRRGAWAAAVLGVLIFACAGREAEAASCYWNGAEGVYANWSSANWLSAEPVAADSAYLGRTGATSDSRVTVTNSGEVALWLFVGYDAGKTGYVNMTGGNLTSSYTYLGRFGTGTFTQSGGTATLGALTLGDELSTSGTYGLTNGAVNGTYVYVGDKGTGTFTHSAGSLTSQTLTLGYMADGSGTYTFGNGTISQTDEIIGWYGDGGFTQNGGTNTVTGELYIARAGGSTGSYVMTSGDLTAAGSTIGASGNMDQSGGTVGVTNILQVRGSAASPAVYTLSGTGALTADTLKVGSGATAAGRFEWMAGSLTANSIEVAPSGEFVIGFSYNVADLLDGTLTGGTITGLDTATLSVSGGTTTQDSGTLTVDELDVGTDEGEGTYEIDNTAELYAKRVKVGKKKDGRVRHKGGKVELEEDLELGKEGGKGTYEYEGAQLRVKKKLKVRTDATSKGEFRGWGDVDIDEDLVNNGKVIADGKGTEKTLRMKVVKKVKSDIENTTDKGWYAKEKAELKLRKKVVQVSPKTTVNWGESDTDTVIDMVNSVRMDFYDVDVEGEIDVSLLGREHSKVKGGLHSAVGVWDFAETFGFSKVDFTFRYDHTAALALGILEEDLKAYHWTGGYWNEMGFTRDAANKHIKVTADHLSLFAIAESADAAAVPEPISVVFLGMGMGAILICAAKRRRLMRRER